MENKMTWEQITDILIQDFQNEHYKKGEKMPGESKLTVRFGVTHAEVRRAYARLEELGYIYSVQGYGSFFAGKKEKIHLMMNDSQSFTEKMNSLGVHYETKNVGFERIDHNPIITEMLELPEKDVDLLDIYKLTRLQLIDGEPAAIHISYLPEHVFPDLAEDFSSITSLSDYMRQCGYDALSIENRELSVSTLDKKERALLDIKGYASCLVLSSKCVHSPTGMILEIARTIYRSDKFVFTL